MTKGHFHTVLDTGEVYYCLRGQGFMVMEDPQGEWSVEPLRPNSVLYVPPCWAHRTVNTGADEDLVTFFVYPGNAGHDYGSIEKQGLPQAGIGSEAAARRSWITHAGCLRRSADAVSVENMRLKNARVLVTPTSFAKNDIALRTALEIEVGEVVYNQSGKPLTSSESGCPDPRYRWHDRRAGQHRSISPGSRRPAEGHCSLRGWRGRCRSGCRSREEASSSPTRPERIQSRWQSWRSD